ncbi:MAG: hypothetical protein N2712_01230 [Brevinematales bacterium]|nr:hypothetical protein [Brevinematales bacterium]
MVRVGFTVFLLLICSIGYSQIQPELSFEYETYRLLEEMPVIFTVRNVGFSDEEFFVYDDILKTFFIEVRTDKNDVVEYSYDFLIKHDFFNLNVSKRSILLKRNQSFSVRIDISKIFDISKQGVYYIRGIFSPDGTADKKDGKSTDFYKLIVKPPKKVEEIVSKVDAEYLSLQQELYNLPPYEVVRRMLDAKYRRDAREFVIYFDFDKLINIFPSFSKRYNESKTASEKAKVIEKFKDYLTTYWEDQILSFAIVRTEIEGDKAVVVADVDYRLRNTSYRLRYSYELFRTYDNRWLIYSYDVVNRK